MNVHLSLFLLAPWVAEKNGVSPTPVSGFLAKKCPIFDFYHFITGNIFDISK
jgi:hypothetical protein